MPSEFRGGLLRAAADDDPPLGNEGRLLDLDPLFHVIARGVAKIGWPSGLMVAP